MNSELYKYHSYQLQQPESLPGFLCSFFDKEKLDSLLEMGRFKILIFSVTLFLALINNTEGQWQPPDVVPRPLCASQIALANYACAMLPYSTVLPPPPPSSPLSDNHESQGTHSHTHQHRHRHEHQQKIPLSPMEENCCKWVQQLDSECICGLLSRLPAFLERPKHNFSVTVGGSCDATYSCGGGIKF